MRKGEGGRGLEINIRKKGDCLQKRLMLERRRGGGVRKDEAPPEAVKFSGKIKLEDVVVSDDNVVISEDNIK